MAECAISGRRHVSSKPVLSTAPSTELQSICGTHCEASRFRLASLFHRPSLESWQSMTEATERDSTLVTLTVDIVAAHVTNNSVAVGDLPSLIHNVH